MYKQKNEILNNATVKVLLAGYAQWKGYATQKACGSISLIISRSNLIENEKENIIVVDTGVPSMRDRLLKYLKKELKYLSAWAIPNLSTPY